MRPRIANGKKFYSSGSKGDEGSHLLCEKKVYPYLGGFKPLSLDQRRGGVVEGVGGGSP